MNVIVRIIITVLDFLVIFKIGETAGYEKCSMKNFMVLRNEK